MIDNIEISRFRGFQSLKLKGLKRINVIVGPNGAGKTALMEAIFMAGGATPDLALRIKAFRGLNSLSFSNARGSYEALWKDLFYKFDETKPVTVKLNGTPSYARSLAISYRRDETMVLPLESKDANIEVNTALVPITFEWSLPSGKKYQARPTIQPGGLAMVALEAFPPLPISFFASSANATQEENAMHFSALSVKNHEDEIVDALRSEFPFVRGLSVQLFGGAPTVFASVKDIDEKVPVNLLSSGITKLLSILLGIVTQKGGVVCLDEIENGFYYERLPSIWALMHRFATQFDVQIFASTHSLECLQAAVKTIESSEKDFTLLQGLSDKGKVNFRQHSGSAFAAAINQNVDVR